MKNWTNIGLVILVDRLTKKGTTFDSLEQLMAGAGSNLIYNIGENTGVTKTTEEYYSWPEKRYYILDCNGLVIPFWKISEVYNNIPPREDPYCLGFRLYQNTGTYQYRYGAVPGTGKKQRYSRFIKHPHTFAEKREGERLFVTEAEEYNLKPRGHRTPQHLPDIRDGRTRGNLRNSKCWKAHRKTQWKPCEIM